MQQESQHEHVRNFAIDMIRLLNCLESTLISNPPPFNVKENLTYATYLWIPKIIRLLGTAVLTATYPADSLDAVPDYDADENFDGDDETYLSVIASVEKREHS
jgi:hypothetical protein